MKKVLFIAYYFPPIGGGGVQRSLKFVKYLPHFGFAPQVLTAAAPPAERWSPRDEQLLADLPDEAEVHRIPNLPPVEGARGWRRRWGDVCGLETPFGRAWRQAIVADGTRICRRDRPSVIFVTLSPFEGAAAAAELARRFNLPWVADLRDPWALDEMQVFASGVHRRLARERMRRVLSSAALVIMNTPEAARRLVLAFPEFANRAVVDLTNGYDAEDFAELTHHPDPQTFRLVHTGSLHTRQGQQVARQRAWLERLGRIEPGVDFLARSPAYLLDALHRWSARDASVLQRVRLTLAGSLTAADRRLVQDSPVASLVDVGGHASHAETLQLQANADLLFLPMHNLPPGRRATIVPGKTYEYLATQRPILAAVPDGDAREFVQAAGTGSVCRPDDVDAMVNILQQRYQQWQRGAPVPAANRAAIERFERRYLTEQLAELLAPVAERAPLSAPLARRATRAFSLNGRA